MKPLLSFLAVFVLAFLPFSQAQAQAQTSSTYDSDILSQLAAKQVVLSLDSEYHHVRAQTLKNVIVFSTLYRDHVHLGSAVRAIANLAEVDSNDQNQRLAVAALRAIGSFRAKHYLTELDTLEEDEYRLLVANVINEYHTKRVL